MKPILKWPGGKSREIAKIYGLIPDFDRYIEPFFGGGALYFHLEPEKAAINDVCRDLMDFYRLVKEQDRELEACLTAYAGSFHALLDLARSHVTDLIDVFRMVQTDKDSAREVPDILLDAWMPELMDCVSETLALDEAAFRAELYAAAWDKLCRTAKNHEKRPFSPADLRENLVTGFTSGYYLYFRQVYNDWSLGKIQLSPAQKAANFFFVRESCYGSMFRYNKNGEFNIPYGGMSYNKKDMMAKVRAMFREEIAQLMAGTQMESMDFEAFLAKVQPTENDFLFLDPPYDTEFSDYEGTAFTKLDQARLAVALTKTKAKFLLIIKNTDFIQGLYGKGFYVQKFDKQYTYNVRSRNDRKAEHLIITNFNTDEL